MEVLSSNDLEAVGPSRVAAESHGVALIEDVRAGTVRNRTSWYQQRECLPDAFW